MVSAPDKLHVFGLHRNYLPLPGILCLMHSKLLFASSMVPYILPALALLFTIDVI